jgi:hypothetical protein
LAEAGPERAEEEGLPRWRGGGCEVDLVIGMQGGPARSLNRQGGGAVPDRSPHNYFRTALSLALVCKFFHVALLQNNFHK